MRFILILAVLIIAPIAGCAFSIFKPGHGEENIQNKCKKVSELQDKWICEQP